MTTPLGQDGFPTDFEALFHQAPAGYVITGIEGTILEVNDTFLSWSGLERDAVQGSNFLKLFPVGDRIMYATHALPQLATTGALSELVADIIGSGGQRHPAMLSATRSPAAPGRQAVDRIVVFSAPRRRSYESELEAALRKAEEAELARIRAEALTAAHREALAQKDQDLRASLQQSRTNEALLNAILDTVDVGIAVVDAQGNRVIKNTRYQYDLEHATARENGEGPDSGMLLYGPDHATAVPRKDLPLWRAAQGESFSEQIFWVGTAEDRRALSFSARPIPDGGFAGSVLAFTDVTRLTNAVSAQTDFVANVSHELRTPLTSIIGYLELILDEPELPAHVTASLTVVMRNSERLLQLVGDLLSTATANSPVTPEPTELGELIRARITSAKLRAELNGVAITATLPPVMSAAVDPLRIGQVFDNLLSNAIKYSPDGGQVTVSARCTVENIIIEIADTGIGMKPDEVQNAFSKFFRSGAVLKAAIPGAGLGLAITKSIVKAHQGTITLASDYGHGTTVTLTLPRLAEEPQSPRP
ncbi:ATP-binding protein [Specibacter sp. NPDC057265]|uniref:PAS domain-containing sensor histidine kinase n=1 Tax=Specibacter sp. NPDC057265 TaxID=3346075 RepID=UPI00362AC923